MSRTDDLIHQAAENVRVHGWHATGVFPTASDPAEVVPFTYTAGFRTTWGHPDIIISALPADVAYRLLAVVAERIEAGDRFAAGDTAERIVQNYPVRFGPVGDPQRLERMTLTAAIYDRFDFDALQLMWPDKNGRFPDEDGYCDNVTPTPRQEVLA